jgi:predicted nucleotidyltransferase
VYGSVAKESDRSDSDVDLMVIGEDVTHGELFAVLEPVSAALGRQVNPTAYSPAEFRRRAREAGGFVKRVLEQPRTWIIGSDRDLA